MLKKAPTQSLSTHSPRKNQWDRDGAYTELKATTGERNEYSSLQTSWSNWARQTLDASIERGTRKTITDRQHLTPETYGAIKDKAREEVLRDLQHDKQDQVCGFQKYRTGISLNPGQPFQ